MLGGNKEFGKYLTGGPQWFVMEWMTKSAETKIRYKLCDFNLAHILSMTLTRVRRVGSR